jgi:hypothetical protein
MVLALLSLQWYPQSSRTDIDTATPDGADGVYGNCLGKIFGFSRVTYDIKRGNVDQAVIAFEDNGKAIRVAIANLFDQFFVRAVLQLRTRNAVLRATENTSLRDTVPSGLRNL